MGTLSALLKKTVKRSSKKRTVSKTTKPRVKRTKRTTKKKSTVARVPGTRKSLARHNAALKNKKMRVYALASKQAYVDYKKGKISGLRPGMKFGDLLKSSIYQGYRHSLVKK